jgi:hypothetical protein
MHMLQQLADAYAATASNAALPVGGVHLMQSRQIAVVFLRTS